MTFQVPSDDQFVVFWIDPLLTLSANRQQADGKLYDEARKLTYNKYVGYISGYRLTTEDEDETGPERFNIKLLVSGSPPVFPSLCLTSRLNIPLIYASPVENTSSIKTSVPLPWPKTFVMSLSNIDVICDAFESDIAPVSLLNYEEKDDFDDLRRDHIARWRRARYPWNLTSNDSDMESDEDEEEERQNARSEHAEGSSGDPRPYEVMLGGFQGLSVTLGVGMSADLTLVKELPDPTDFYREQIALQDLIVNLGQETRPEETTNDEQHLSESSNEY